jgi:Rhodopirellula transposase DDE domain
MPCFTVDLIVVDEVTRTPIGRPVLTLAIDIHTRVATGFYLDLDYPSILRQGFAANHGWVSVGISADTGAFAVETIRRWWYKLGKTRYPDATCLTIPADCSGSNGPQVKLRKCELQRLTNETGLKITVTDLPPGTSKWNRIEHRLFAFITMNWRGKSLVSHQVTVQLIGSTTTTETGLNIGCDLDRNHYPKGVEVSDEETQAINIIRRMYSTASGITPLHYNNKCVEAPISLQGLARLSASSSGERPLVAFSACWDFYPLGPMSGHA